MTAPEPKTETPNAVTDEEAPARDAAAPGLKGALARYRVLAYIVGVGLLALVGAMIMRYVFDQRQYSAIVGPVHGFLYVVYLVLAVDLGLKARWPIVKTGLILLAGMIPFVSFVAERKVTKELSEG
jgi:integral membrane protein